MGDDLGARREIEQAAELDKEEMNQNSAFTANRTGAMLASKKDWDSAIEQFRKALALNPDFAEARFNLAGALGDKGEVERAVAEFGTLLSAHPEWISAYYELGGDLERLRRWDEAAQAYRQAIRLNPDFAQAHASMGAILFQQAEFKAAEGEFSRALELDPSNDVVRFNRASCLIRLGRSPEAVRELTVFIQRNRNSAVAHNLLGVAYAQSGNLTAAVIQFGQAIRLDPEISEAQANLDRALEELRQEKARKGLKSGQD